MSDQFPSYHVEDRVDWPEGELFLPMEDVESASDPDERVERFLEENSVLFTASRQAWRDRRMEMATFSRHHTGFQDVVRPYFPRHMRRKVDMRALFEAESWNAAAYDVQARAMRDIDSYLDLPGIMRPDTSMDQRLDKLRGEIASHHYIDLGPLGRDELQSALAEAGNEHSDEQFQALEKYFALYNNLYHTIVSSEVLEALAAYNLETFLRDPDVVRPFIERIIQLCDDGHERQEFPGLLELLACNIQRNSEKGLLYEPCYLATADTSVNAQSFISACLAGQSDTRIPQNLQVPFAVIGLVFSDAQEHEDWQSEVAAKIATQLERWPRQLTDGLRHFHGSYQREYWDRLRQAVSRYAYDARSSGMRISKPVRNKQSRVGAKALSSGPVVRTQPINEPPKEVEYQPVQRLAAIRPAHDTLGGKPVYRLDYLDSAAELITETNLQAYIDKYNRDGNVAMALQAALEHLRNQPYDPVATRRLRNVPYYLETSTAHRLRHARRLSLQRLPQIVGGQILRRTRIIYDYLIDEGQPTLAVYGAYLKRDIEEMAELPKR